MPATGCSLKGGFDPSGADMPALCASDADPKMVIVSCVGGSLIVLLLGFIWKVATVRKVSWIAARPQLEPASVDRMPEGIRQTVAQVAPSLAVLGFRIVENVQAPRFSTYTLWSQVLFLNRETGERASVIGMKEFQSEAVSFAFATEFSSGARIVTEWTNNVLAKKAVANPPLADPNPLEVPGLYARHRERVAEAIARRPAMAATSEILRGVLPGHGEELDWRRARAGLVAANTAGKLGYRIDANGDYFRPSRARAVRLALKKRTPRTRPSGFDVVLR